MRVLMKLGAVMVYVYTGAIAVCWVAASYYL